MTLQHQKLNAFQMVRPRGVDRPSAGPVKGGVGKPPLLLPGSQVRVLDGCGRLRPAEQSAAQRSFVIETKHQSRASRDKRHALVKGGL